MLQEKREQALEQLESLQLTKEEPPAEDEAFRFQFFGENHDLLRKNNVRHLRRLVDLGTCLYRLHVQFIMCLEIYHTYFTKIIKVAKKMEVT